MHPVIGPRQPASFLNDPSTQVRFLFRSQALITAASQKDRSAEIGSRHNIKTPLERKERKIKGGKEERGTFSFTSI
jgi:hypothetical protein